MAHFEIGKLRKQITELERSREYLLTRNGNLEDANQGLRDMHQSLTGQVVRADDDQRKREKYIRLLEDKNAALRETRVPMPGGRTVKWLIPFLRLIAHEDNLVDRESRGLLLWWAGDLEAATDEPD